VTLGLLGPVDITSLSHPLPLAPPAAWAAQQQLPEAEYARLAEVRGKLQDQKYAAAEVILTRSLELWQKTEQPPLEIATMLKDRSNARLLSNPQGALADLDAVLKIYAEMSAEERPNDDVFAATFLRGQVNQRLSLLEAAESDFSAALDLDAENPFLWSARGDTRARRADWAGAAQDYLTAETQFKVIGDKIRRTLSAADASIAMYGSVNPQPSTLIRQP
jgi:tetratricopeptide (TPR) repeat protein